jgi:signal transduction histidine kinase
MMRPRILIVEDEGLLAEELMRRMVRMGMDVVGVTGVAEEAIALAAEHTPDLVLMDIRLRGRIDGITAASAIRQRDNVPVVFITAHSDAVTIERAKEAAPLGYLIKPFNDRDLYVAIEMALHKRATDRMTHKLLEAQRLESLGRLAEGVARDLGNVLAPILGNVRLATEQAPAGSKLARQLETITAAAERASALCRQMREYAGAGEVVTARGRLDDLVAETEQLLQVAVARQATLTVEFGSGGAEVDMERAQIRQVLMNLALNAAEAVAESGAVTIRTQRTRVDADAVEGLEPGDYALVEVCDTGMGLDEETRRRVFEPFFTTKGAGRGLGLASAQGIARAHGGLITVSSAPGEGATFRLYLPAAAAVTDQASTTGVAQPTVAADTTD